MASQDLKRRHKDDPTTNATKNISYDDDNTNNNTSRRAKKLAMAKRGLRSLSLAVAAPVALSALAVYLSGCGGGREVSGPSWAFNLATALTAGLMGFSAWLFWAEGGFHRYPVALALYMGQLLLGLLWAPLVFGAGARWAGLLVCAAMFAVLYGCSNFFKRVNPMAGDLVVPCMAWVLFLAVFNYKLG